MKIISYLMCLAVATATVIDETEGDDFPHFEIEIN
jgi:hypothetical protein